MADGITLVVWCLTLAGSFYAARRVQTANGKARKRARAMEREERRYRRRMDRAADKRLRRWRGQINRPKTVAMITPLIIFLIVVALFLTQTIVFSVITSESMSPTLRKGDLLLMQSIDTEVEPGDIIMFHEPTMYNGVHPPVVHRVVEVTEEGIRTAGDASGNDTWLVPHEDVMGKAVMFQDGPVKKGDWGAVRGKMFIEGYTEDGEYTGGFHFTNLMVSTMKNYGTIVFFLCVFLYVFLAMKEAREKGQ
jgi:signal peptidase